jgi:hypothetical protein
MRVIIYKLGTTLVVTSNRSTLHSISSQRVTANVVPSSPILIILMMEAIRFSETSVLTRVRRRHIPKDVILQDHISITFFHIVYFHTEHLE